MPDIKKSEDFSNGYGNRTENSKTVRTPARTNGPFFCLIT